MGYWAKKHLAAMFVVLALTLCLIQLPKVHPEEFSAQGRTVAFVRDVLLIDVDKYNLTYLGPFTESPDLIANVAEVHGKVTLSSETGIVEVLYEYADGVLNFCDVRLRDTSPKFIQPLPTDLHGKIADFLTRYQAFSGDQSLQELNNMLKNIDLTKDSTTLSNSSKLEVKMWPSGELSFSWQVMFGGAGYGKFSFSFADGYFTGFLDDRSYVKVGGGYVNVSKDQAVQIALSNAQVPSWASAIVYDQIYVGLFTKSRDSTWVWYPYWIVTLPLSGNYNVQTHGGVITVEIWADTAQVIRTYMGTSPYGERYNATSPSPSPSPSPTPTASPTQSPQPTQTMTPPPALPTQSPTPATTPTLELAPSPSTSPTITQQPMLGPIPTQVASPPLYVEDFPGYTGQQVGIAVAIMAVIAVGVVAYFYFKKRGMA